MNGIFWVGIATIFAICSITVVGVYTVKALVKMHNNLHN